MSDPKRHHTVPQTYLSNFSDVDGRLTIWSKRRNKKDRPTPGNALVRGYYYSQPEKGVDRENHSLETGFLNEIETRYPELFQSLVSNGSNIDSSLLFQTILMMRSRSTAFREAFELGLADYVNRIRRSMPASDFPPPPEHLTDILDSLVVAIDPHRSILAMAYYIDHYMLPLATMEWSLKSVRGRAQLLTSDNPVVWYESGYEASLPRVYGREISARTRAIFPISRKYALVGRPSKFGEYRFTGYAGDLSPKQVREINELQVACAWDEIIGEIKLPASVFGRLARVAPFIQIEYYEPNSGAFLISDTGLAKIRDKVKFGRRRSAGG